MPDSKEELFSILMAITRDPSRGPAIGPAGPPAGGEAPSEAEDGEVGISDHHQRTGHCLTRPASANGRPGVDTRAAVRTV
jgi:hypothetical protein